MTDAEESKDGTYQARPPAMDVWEYRVQQLQLLGLDRHEAERMSVARDSAGFLVDIAQVRRAVRNGATTEQILAIFC